MSEHPWTAAVAALREQMERQTGNTPSDEGRWADVPPPDDPGSPAEGEADAARDPLSSARGMADLVDEALPVFRARREGADKPVPMPWPVIGAALNGGLWPGLYFIVGATGSGKSQAALQMALHAAEAGTPVLYVGLELGGPDLVARLLGLMEQRPWSGIWLGKGPPPNPATTERLRNLPIHLDFGEAFGWSYDLLPGRVAAMAKQYGRPPMVVLDFLQLVQSPDEERQDLRERIGRASYAGRQAARDHEAVVVLISSTARQNYDAVNKISRLGKSNFPVKWPGTLVGLGKESGETEYSADCVLALVRDRSVGQLDYAGRKWSWLWLAVAKLRAGPPCWRPLLFDGSRMKEPPPSLVTHYALLHCDRNGYNRNDHPDDTDATDAFEKAWTSADVPAHEQREINQWEEEGRKVAERLRAAEQARREKDKKGKRGAGNQKRDPKPAPVPDSGADI